MKNKIVAMFKVAVVAAVLTSCNNAAEVQKQVDEQNAKIQSQVDEKLSGLQAEVDAECTAKIDTLAQAKYDEWYTTEGKKKGAKAVVKPKPVVTKKEEPKVPVDPKKSKMEGEQQTNVEQKKDKMSGKVDSTSLNKKKNKMSGN
jgi:hypothetical protein